MRKLNFNKKTLGEIGNVAESEDMKRTKEIEPKKFHKVAMVMTHGRKIGNSYNDERSCL